MDALDLLITGRSPFLLSKSSLLFNNVMVLLISTRLSLIQNEKSSINVNLLVVFCMQIIAFDKI